MEIDLSALPDFNPGWLSRLALPWRRDAQPMAVASLAPLGVPPPLPLATLADWPGMTTSNVMQTVGAQNILRQLRRWMPVTLPPPGNASRTITTTNARLPFDYRLPRRPRRGGVSMLGVDLAEENATGEQETSLIGGQYLDLLVPPSPMQEHEPAWADLSRLIPSSALAPMLDYQPLASLRPNRVLQDLGIAAAQLPLAMVAQDAGTESENTETPEGTSAPGHESMMNSEPAPLYRAAELRLPTQRNPVERNPAPLALSRNLASVLRTFRSESPGTGAQVDASDSVNRISAPLTRIVAERLPFTPTVIRELSKLPILRDRQGERERSETDTSAPNSIESFARPAQFVALRPVLTEPAGQVQTTEAEQTEPYALPSNAAEPELANGLVRPLATAVALKSEDRFNETAPFLPPLFNITMEPSFASGISLDTQVPMQGLTAPLGLTLGRAAPLLPSLRTLAALAEPIANIVRNPILSNPPDESRFATANLRATASTGDMPPHQALAVRKLNQPPKIDRVKGFDSALEPPAIPAPQTVYPVMPTPPAMQVRRMVSEAGPRGSATEYVGEYATPGLAGETPATAHERFAPNEKASVAEPLSPSSSRVASGPLGFSPAPAPPDVNALARQVYALLQDRLRAERERHDVYGR